MFPKMKLDLFAGIPVSEFVKARKWFEQLLGSPPAFLPHRTEAVWELAEHRYVYIVEQPEHAGHARLTVFVEDLDKLVASIGARGLESTTTESYPDGVRKVSYRDSDGNEVGFGGAPKRRTQRTSRPRKGSRSTGASARRRSH
jgi:hypothetical protein